jgi:lipoate---protein ligase
MRPAVEIVRGNAPTVVAGIEGDFAMLAEPCRQAARVWRCAESAIVLGVSRDADAEIDAPEAAARGMAVLRRASGGGTVVLGPGTLQYAILVPHPDPAPAIDAIKQACNRAVCEALAASGIDAALESDCSGDLRMGSHKIGGVALRRRREATLLHGTLLVTADLAEIAAVLRHPEREPAWRCGRPHLEFLATLGQFDHDRFESTLHDAIARFL